MRKEMQILVLPVFNLTLTKKINKEIKIKNVTFIDRDKLVRTRKRFGFNHTFSEINKIFKLSKIKILGSANTYALIKYKTDNSDLSKPISLIKEAVYILASLQLLNRSHVAKFGLFSNVIRPKQDQLLYNPNTNYMSISFKSTNNRPYFFDDSLSLLKNHHFFPQLLKILNREIRINKKWQKDIERAAILAGKSIFSTDLSEAFLNNMIAIETLLTTNDDKHRIALKERLTALFHWYFSTDKTNWDTQIDRIYHLRCNMVHNGNIKEITTKDLLISDKILYNLLLNICISITKIDSKSKLIIISEKLKACETLNIPFKSGLNKGIFLNNRIDAKDIEKLRIEMNWEM